MPEELPEKVPEREEAAGPMEAAPQQSADQPEVTSGEDKSEPTELSAPSAPLLERKRQALEPLKRLKAKVIHGFGRGSKVLGFPTANMEVRWGQQDDLEALSKEERDILEFAQTCETGIYYAWAQVVDGPDRGIYKAAMSIGWNPTFTDVQAKTIEPWILHDFSSDFYDCELRVLVCGYVRPEYKFDHFPHLITAIREDGEFCRDALDQVADLTADDFFLAP